ncbi:HAD family hydrolase [Methanobacterium sp.]|uniref:HAD family hydrolase n=1 Tax=Methanobacterium sp. TaxID=2164 RepID=UPI003D64CD88
MQKLILFDIDKTLIDRSQCHHDAFTNAFKEVYGVDITIDHINYHGMTDPQIIMEVLGKKGLEESLIKSKSDECLKALANYFEKNVKNDNMQILKGVKELLKELDEYMVLMGLVTGNIEPIAWGKMKKLGINRYFKVGGFGSDDINRTVLVKTAIKRAQNNYGFSGETFVIGDTPKDIKAGFEANAKTIAVATGIYSITELENSGADYVFRSLEDKEEILDIILK